jgi:hypothetical protein
VKLANALLVSGITSLSMLLAACGGGGSAPPATISVAFAAPPPGNLAIGATAGISAAVSNDSAAAGVTWTVTCGSTQCGSFNPATSPGNTATTTYTAPAAIPTGNTVTVVATSVSDTSKSASATITIVTSTAAVLPNGNYVYHVAGEDSNGPYFVAGVFTVESGNITGGEQDYVDPAGGTTNTLVSSGSSLSSTSGGNIQIVLNTGNAAIGVGGLETFRGTVVSNTRVLISEFDLSAAASGSLDLQTGTAAPAGGYAFNLGGLDGGSPASPLAIGGVLNISGGNISVANSVFDYNDAGSVGQAQTFTSGTVSDPDAFGRVTISLTPSTASGVPQIGLSAYVVGNGTIQLIENLNDGLLGTMGGTALSQGSHSGNFTADSVGGTSYVFISSGEDVNGVANFAGGFILNSNGTVGGDLAYNDPNLFQGLNITGGTWTVDPTGRVTLTNLTTTTSSIGGPFNFQLYLDGSGNALELGVDAIQVTSGPAYLQSADATVNPGNYGIQAQGFAFANGLPVWAAVGPVTLDSSLNWTGFTDFTVLTGAPDPSVTLTGSTTTSQGLFNILGLNAVLPPPNGPGEFGYFPIDGTRVLAIEVDDNQIGEFIIEGVTPE